VDPKIQGCDHISGLDDQSIFAVNVYHIARLAGQIPRVAAETDCEPSDRPCSRTRKKRVDQVSSLTTWEMASRTETGLPQERLTRTIGLTS
jgi:hypothetical protein